MQENTNSYVVIVVYIDVVSLWLWLMSEAHMRPASVEKLSSFDKLSPLHVNLQDETNKYQRNGMNTGIRDKKAIKYNLGKKTETCNIWQSQSINIKP